MKLFLTDEIKGYIAALSSVGEKHQIGQYFERQRELAYRLKKPVSNSLRDGIHEIRPGPHRFLFFYRKQAIVVVHAFRKKTNKTPEGEINAAIRKRQPFFEEGYEAHELG
jgi:phage-related protein